ncbi:hypothetical protein [Planktothrix agardhii]|uniref:hypothetical protein n=1 Tax=Planktothrix agardhii TaxID=1160 RepID=UPI0005A7DAF2|nr:hypothetical protein [Planktothrix agardhii]
MGGNNSNISPIIRGTGIQNTGVCRNISIGTIQGDGLTVGSNISGNNIIGCGDFNVTTIGCINILGKGDSITRINL